MIKLRPHQERIVKTMTHTTKGQVIVPTGGGKTMCMITDAHRQFQYGNQTIVVVAPRILLAQQLSDDFLKIIDNAKVLHVHSGESEHFSTTNSNTISEWVVNNWNDNKIIFTTYHSLNRIQQSSIPVNTIYFDEAHNSVQRHFHTPTRFFATTNNRRCFFFTATPHHIKNDERGMNNQEVYGRVIEQVPAPELVDAGVILPPKVVVNQCEMIRDRKATCKEDVQNIFSSIDSNSVDKILICAKSTKQIAEIACDIDFWVGVGERGYSWMFITSKHGAFIDGKKVARDKFFDTLNKWGKDDNKRFIVMHHSILSEGINVNGLEAVLFLRSMNYIGISQTIGRVIRKGNVNKQFGIVSIPVYNKVGITTSKRVGAVVDTIFEKGEPAISISRR